MGAPSTGHVRVRGRPARVVTGRDDSLGCGGGTEIRKEYT